MRWRRFRKWAKWTCTLAACAAVALVVFSGLCESNYTVATNAGDTEWTVGVGHGQVGLLYMHGLHAIGFSQPSRWFVRWRPDWYWGYAGEKTPSDVLSTWHAGVVYDPVPLGWEVGASVLYPVALTLIPAALLWYADRRRFKHGACGGCGYERRGLAVGVKCPECGTVPAPASK